ncbi:hypothetical protein [Lacrimispora sp.]|uniref:hypothetical protein n=1 Tax=Lacrimispora sp. TaxID=2719234 RepID=UPI002898C0F3|nr:hypothetical protein [Lacrimispora sp.]
MSFENLEQRIAQGYIDLLPPFVPDDHGSVSVGEQQRFYILIKKLYQLAFDEPLLFVASLHEDDAYPGFIKSSYGKPELQVNMRKFSKTIDMLLQNMFLMGQGSQVKWNKRQKAIFSKLGINDFANIPEAWLWLSTRPDSNLTEFSFCLFNKEYPYTSDIYAYLLGEEAFRKLENRMIGQGYRRFDIYNITASDCKLSLNYANPMWSKDRPTGGFEYKIRYTGISARYDSCFQNPVVFGLCIPNGLKTYLKAFDSANTHIKNFIIEHTKKCDGCKYCVQTDQTGTRPLAKMKVVHNGEAYHLCPYFPGYGYRWHSINDELAEQLIEMLAFMDKLYNHSDSQHENLMDND